MFECFYSDSRKLIYYRLDWYLLITYNMQPVVQSTWERKYIFMSSVGQIKKSLHKYIVGTSPAHWGTHSEMQSNRSKKSCVVAAEMILTTLFNLHAVGRS